VRKLTDIVIHCSATDPKMDIGSWEIRKWHLAQGWKDIGYHFVIRLNGAIEQGRPVEQVGAHVQGHNSTTIGVCYVGGVKGKKAADTMNHVQEFALAGLVTNLRREYGALEVMGHNDYTKAKACPSFKVASRLAYMKLANCPKGRMTLPDYLNPMNQ
jgi:N-acetylmuramoyl-L-alanine amidase